MEKLHLMENGYINLGKGVLSPNAQAMYQKKFPEKYFINIFEYYSNERKFTYEAFVQFERQNNEYGDDIFSMRLHRVKSIGHAEDFFNTVFESLDIIPIFW